MRIINHTICNYNFYNYSKQKEFLIMMNENDEMTEEFPDMMNGYNIFEEDTPTNENDVSGNLFINNRWFIPLIIAIFAIIIFNYHYSSPKHPFEFVDFDEFEIYSEKLKSTFDPFKLPYCNNSGQQNQSVITDLGLNEFCEIIEISKSTYAKMYSDGVWFFWEIEQCIRSILNRISNKSLFTFFINSNEKIIVNFVQESIESLKTFNSSIGKSYEITSIAESFRNSTHKQVIKAKIEARKLIFDECNLSLWNKFRNYIYSIFDERGNGLTCGTREDFLEDLDNDLRRIANILLNFKENLEIQSNYLHKLSDNIDFLESNKLEIQKINFIRKLLSMIKENHKEFNK
ncbi:hypothetical protein RclHR1_08620006 [Rhizophagus clarus]|uniref:Uncharacterized protein n=1 Tax=Rhizophagus clarus TaxID=94130 RepID=A0A2Z6SFQ3_9GLOM|nr:hypothetical protein RclHR1_08620006 [Rhizophagus clarus]